MFLTWQGKNSLSKKFQVEGDDKVKNKKILREKGQKF